MTGKEFRLFGDGNEILQCLLIYKIVKGIDTKRREREKWEIYTWNEWMLRIGDGKAEHISEHSGV